MIDEKGKAILQTGLLQTFQSNLSVAMKELFAKDIDLFKKTSISSVLNFCNNSDGMHKRFEVKVSIKLLENEND